MNTENLKLKNGGKNSTLRVLFLVFVRCGGDRSLRFGRDDILGRVFYSPVYNDI